MERSPCFNCELIGSDKRQCSDSCNNLKKFQELLDRNTGLIFGIDPSEGAYSVSPPRRGE